MRLSGRRLVSVSTVVERRPVIYNMETWEHEYEQWKEKSRKAEMGRTDVRGALTLQVKAAGVSKKAATQQADTHSVKKTKMDLDAEFEALRRYNRTEADETGATDTLMRAYDRRLYLLTGGEGKWSFPTVELEPEADKTLREAAERAAREALGPYSCYMFGNAPIGHLESNHFFFYGEIVWLNGQRLPDVSRMTDSAWVTRDELPKYLSEDVWQMADKALTKV